MTGVQPRQLEKSVIARQKVLARRQGWLTELAEHRETHNQSRFRWWAEDVMSTVTWNTWGRIDFTELKHLAWLEDWRQGMYEYGFDCQLGMAPPLIEAGPMFGSDWAEIGATVGLSSVQCQQVMFFHGTGTPAQRVPNSQVRRIHRMAYSNPLIQIWEIKQLWLMYMAAVDVHEDTLIDLIEELRPTHRMSDILRASNTHSEERLEQRIAAARNARGGPNDPRRAPRQTFT